MTGEGWEWKVEQADQSYVSQCVAVVQFKDEAASRQTLVGWRVRGWTTDSSPSRRSRSETGLANRIGSTRAGGAVNKENCVRRLALFMWDEGYLALQIAISSAGFTSPTQVKVLLEVLRTYF